MRRDVGRYSADERIRAVGSVNSDRTSWKLGQAECIERIESGKDSSCVEQPAGHRVAVVVAKSAAGNKYVKTPADCEQPDNLLSLPACP